MLSGATVLPATGWDPPLVGRREELDFVRTARRGGKVGGVVLGGAQGVGKTRLAGEAASYARADGWAAERATGTAAASAAPLAAFADLLPRTAIEETSTLAAILTATQHLTTGAAGRPMVIHVDDAHHLDAASIELVRRLAHVRGIFLLVTLRSDQVVPQPLVDLWKDGAAHRLEVQPLSRDDTYSLAEAALGGDVDPGTLSQLWNMSVGNPLFLRELLLADQEQGTLRRVRGTWRRHGDVAPSLRLIEIVRTRLARLNAEERDVVETLAVGDALDLDLLATVGSASALERLVDAGMVQVSGDGAAALLRLGHPVYGTVLRAGLSAPRRRAIRLRLLDAVRARCGVGRAMSRRTDLIRETIWRLDEGESIEARHLLVAAHCAATEYPHSLAERLAAYGLDAGVIGTGPGPPVPFTGVRDDLAVAVRFARAALRTETSPTAGIALATQLIALGRADEAEAALAGIEGDARTRAEVVQIAVARATLLFWLRGDADRATTVLVAAERALDGDEERGFLARLRARVAFDSGHPNQAAELASGALARHRDVGPVAALLAATLAQALAFGGQATAAIDTIDRHLDLALTHVQQVPDAVVELMLARIFADRWLGRLGQAEAFARGCYQPAADQGTPNSMAVFGGAVGHNLLDQGKPRSAAGWLGESAALMLGRDPLGYRPWPLACLAMAVAQCGDPTGAARVIAEAETIAAHNRHFDSQVLLGRAWAQAAAGDEAGALTTMRRAADVALGKDLRVFAADALHAAVRLGRPRGVTAELSRLAEETGSPLAAAYAMHAAALGARDGAALEEAATAFEHLGAMLLAAEAAVHATITYDRQGARPAAARAANRSAELARECEGARTPALRHAVRAPGLTVREREVAALTADGLSNKAIAERLTVSVRTVENHLYRIFTKLDVRDRAGLADVLAGPGVRAAGR